MKLVVLAAITFVPSVVLGIMLMGGGFDIGLSDASAAAGNADLEVQSVTVEAPGSTAVSVPFNVTVKAVLRNKGPVGPVDAPIDFTLSTPADCIRIPGGPFETVTSSQQTGAAVPVSVTWSVTCNSVRVGEFRGTATALSGSGDAYVDPNPGNNFGESTTSVIITSPPTPEPAAKALPSSGGRTTDGSGPWFRLYVAVFAGFLAALALTVGGGYARKRRLR